MPDSTKLKIRDRTRISRVPPQNLFQHERELAERIETTGWTADSIERIIALLGTHPTSTNMDVFGCDRESSLC